MNDEESRKAARDYRDWFAKKNKEQIDSVLSRPISSFVQTYMPHDIKGRFIATSPISIDSSVYFDNSGDIMIGSGCSFSRGVMIYTHEHYHDRALTIFEALEKKGVKVSGIEIGDDVYIGAGAIILASCNIIQTGAVIGAGAIVTCDIPGYEIWAGNPARYIGVRK